MSAFFPWLDSTAWPNLAPQNLTQSILPGMSLITVNETNSSAPDAEQRIVAQNSYGRQIGKLMAAVELLIMQVEVTDPKLKTAKAFMELKTLQAEIDTAKKAAQTARLTRLTDDLKTLKTQNPAAFKDIIDGLF